MRLQVYFWVFLVLVLVQIIDAQKNDTVKFNSTRVTRTKVPQRTMYKARNSRNTLLERFEQLKTSLIVFLQNKIRKLQEQFALLNRVPPNPMLASLPGLTFLPGPPQPPRPWLTQSLVFPPSPPAGAPWYAQAGLTYPNTPQGFSYAYPALFQQIGPGGPPAVPPPGALLPGFPPALSLAVPQPGLIPTAPQPVLPSPVPLTSPPVAQPSAPPPNPQLQGSFPTTQTVATPALLQIQAPAQLIPTSPTAQPAKPPTTSLTAALTMAASTANTTLQSIVNATAIKPGGAGQNVTTPVVQNVTLPVTQNGNTTHLANKTEVLSKPAQQVISQGAVQPAATSDVLKPGVNRPVAPSAEFEERNGPRELPCM